MTNTDVLMASNFGFFFIFFLNYLYIHQRIMD